MKEEIVTIKNLKINFKTEGEGRPFLILPGWGSESQRWQEVGEILSKKNLKVIIPDLPGFGKSQIPQRAWGLDDYSDFLEKLTNSLNLEKFYLLGHSFGGAIAIKFSLKFPQKVAKLFLVSAACFRKKGLREKLFYFLAKILKIFSFLPFYSNLRKGFYKFVVRGSDYYSSQERGRRLRDIYLKIISEDLSDILSQLVIPTIIIWGKRDKITKIKQAFLIKNKIKNSRLEILEKTGHNPHQEAPEKLTKIILQSL